MDYAFPGMDPYLEHPALWEGVHARLIVAIANQLQPKLNPLGSKSSTLPFRRADPAKLAAGHILAKDGIVKRVAR